MPYGNFDKVILPVRRNIQDTDYDCGPASLKIILETINKSVSEKRLMGFCNTTSRFGTSFELLSKTLDKLGVEHKVHRRANVRLVEEKIFDLNLCLIDYQSWGEGGKDYKDLKAGHYSVIFGFNKTHFYVADPNKKHTSKYEEWGFRTMNKRLFNNNWNDEEGFGIIKYHWLIAVPLSQKKKGHRKI
jgi:predicted double-glycine peptidase